MAAPNIMPIYFADETKKMFKVEEGVTAGKIAEQVADKLELNENARRCFSIWASTDLLEMNISADDKLSDVISKWPALEKQYKGKSSKNPDLKFYYKRDRLIPKRVERELKDGMAVHLLFLQGISEVVNSIAVCTVEEAINLAGMQMQADFGDHSDHHKKGFLSNQIPRFIPKHLLKDKAEKKRDWEADILAAHEKLKGQDQDKVKNDYLAFVRKFPGYGSTYFDVKVKKSVTPPTKMPKDVHLGVNIDGLHIHDASAHKPLAFYPLVECKVDHCDKTFSLKVEGEKPAEYIFTTHQGQLIDALLTAAIDYSVSIRKQASSIVGGGSTAAAGGLAGGAVADLPTADGAEGAPAKEEAGATEGGKAADAPEEAAGGDAPAEATAAPAAAAPAAAAPVEISKPSELNPVAMDEAAKLEKEQKRTELKNLTEELADSILGELDDGW